MIPPRWAQVLPTPSVSYPTQSNHFEVWRTPVTQAVLVLTDSWPGMLESEIQRRLDDDDSAWVGAVYDPVVGRWYEIVEKGSVEDLESFQTRRDALLRAEFIERDIASARVRRLPDFANEDVAAYLKWFQAQVPNRIDYVRLLWLDDANGAYDALLAEPVSVSEEVFRDEYADFLAPAKNPHGAHRDALLR